MIFRFDIYFGVFFFFKQKTAYEMRISDWSSDVCSSDLETLDARRISEDHHCEVGIWLQGAGHRRFADHPVSLLAWSNMLHFTLQQIGRASCRERVCQYV